MQRQLEACVEYARVRKQFGKFQAVADKVADMHLRLKTARLLVYRVRPALDDVLSPRYRAGGRTERGAS
jgi:alkylation response protein AidB-like acyl-CoA dehydrogenase